MPGVASTATPPPRVAAAAARAPGSITPTTGMDRAAATCGGGPGHTGIVFCDTRVASCPLGSQPGLTPGLWIISARTQNTSGRVYTANYSFAVANAAEWQYTLLFQ